MRGLPPDIVQVLRWAVIGCMSLPRAHSESTWPMVRRQLIKEFAELPAPDRRALIADIRTEAWKRHHWHSHHEHDWWDLVRDLVDLHGPDSHPQAVTAADLDATIAEWLKREPA